MPLTPAPNIRSDAETSPERGIYYHSCRHSAGKPVVAGWSYSWCAQLGDYSSSWTAPVDVSRVPIELDAHDIAGQQMRLVIASLPAGIKPLFTFDAGYDSTRLAAQVGGAEAALLVRLRRNRCFFFDPIHDQERRLNIGSCPRRYIRRLNHRNAGQQGICRQCCWRRKAWKEGSFVQPQSPFTSTQAELYASGSLQEPSLGTGLGADMPY